MDHLLVCMPTGNSIFVVHSNFLSASSDLSHLLLYLNVELLGAFFVIAGFKQLTFNANLVTSRDTYFCTSLSGVNR